MKTTTNKKRKVTRFTVTEKQAAEVEKVIGTKHYVLYAFGDNEGIMSVVRNVSRMELMIVMQSLKKDVFEGMPKALKELLSLH